MSSGLPELGRTFMILGAVLLLLGLLLVSLPGSRLPGDIVYRRGNFTLYLPLATCAVLSVLISLLLWLMRR